MASDQVIPPPPPGFVLQDEAPPPPPGFAFARPNAPPPPAAPAQGQVPRQDMRDLVLGKGSLLGALDKVMLGAGDAVNDYSLAHGISPGTADNLGAGTYVGLNMLTGFAPKAGAMLSRATRASEAAAPLTRIEPTLSDLRGYDELVRPARGRLPFVNPPEGSLAAVTPDIPLSSIRHPAKTERMKTFIEGNGLGFKLPPSAIEHSAPRSVIESLGGKLAIKQEAVEHNQQIVDDIGRRVLGLMADEPINAATIEHAKVPWYKPYEELKALDPRAAGTAAKDGKDGWVFQMSEARANAQRAHRAADAYPPNPQAAKDAKRYDNLTKFYEDKLDALAKEKGRPELLDELRKARQELGKIGDVERAYVEGTGSLDAAEWAKKMNKGGYLSGELRVAARMRNAYPDFTSFAKGRQAADVSHLSAYAAAHALGTGDVATGAMLGLRAPARRLALSDRMQGPLRSGPPGPVRLSDLERYGLSMGLAPGVGLHVPDENQP